MTDPHSDAIQHGPTAVTGVTADPHAHTTHPGLPFSEADWKDFHESDKRAGGAIIVLMSAIFTIGLVLYTVVAVVVAG